MHPQLPQLRQLPIGDKLQIVEELWDDIAASDEPMPLPQWHGDEVRRRAAELEENPSAALSREDLWRRVEQANGQ